MSDQIDTTSTGPTVGTQPTGQSLGGTLEGPSAEGVAGSTDTDTGLDFGPGQSTTTGTLPTQGGASLDGPVDFETSSADDPRDESRHHSTPKVTNGDL